MAAGHILECVWASGLSVKWAVFVGLVTFVACFVVLTLGASDDSALFATVLAAGGSATVAEWISAADGNQATADRRLIAERAGVLAAAIVLALVITAATAVSAFVAIAVCGGIAILIQLTVLRQPHEQPLT